MLKTSFLILFIFFSFLGCSVQDYSKNKKNLITAKQEVADPYIWDFGRVKEGQVLKHSFTLKNETAKTMNIKDVSTSCGCTVSKIKEKILLSGESTSIEVQFDSKGYFGLIQQYVYVNTDNPEKTVLKFIIKANVEK